MIMPGWPGLGFWERVLDEWQKIMERWAVEMGEQVEPVRTDDADVSTVPEAVQEAPEVLDPPSHERQPAGLRAARRIKGTLTRTTRRDLGRAMLDMAAPGGWQASTLNPDLPDPRKFAILSDRFDKISQSDDPHVLYGELLALAAVAAGWAQGIERRAWRDAKRRQRAARRARRRAQRARRRGDHVREPGTVPGLAGPVGPAGHGDVDEVG
jgi:hypothetical protein